MSELRSMYEIDKLSIPQIAARIGEPRSRVRTNLLAMGVHLRSRVEGVRLRGPKLGKHLIGKPHPMSIEARAKLSATKLAIGALTAKGTSKKPSGYIEITRGPDKGKTEHVAIMERRLGRALRADEIVHHIDGDRSNNAENNLALMTYSGHARHHSIIRRLKKCQGQ